MKTLHGKFVEKRKHVRLPVIHGIIQPVDLGYCDPVSPGKTISQPGILSDLSAGGMRLITFVEPPHSKLLDLTLKLPGLGSVSISGKISWVSGKGGVFISGIAFTKISASDRARINAMTEDYTDCDTRIVLRLPEACVPDCRAHFLCNKPQKQKRFHKSKP